MEKNFTWILAGSFAVLLVIVAIALYLFRIERNKFINLQKLVLNQSGFGNTAVAYIRARMAAEQLNLRRPFAHWFLPDYLILTETCLQRALTELRAITTLNSDIKKLGFWYQWSTVTLFLFDNSWDANLRCVKYVLKPDFQAANLNPKQNDAYSVLLGPLNHAMQMHAHSLFFKEGKHALRGAKEKGFMNFSNFVWDVYIEIAGLPDWVSLNLFSKEDIVCTIFKEVSHDIADALIHRKKEIINATISNHDKATALEKLVNSHFLHFYGHLDPMQPLDKARKGVVAELDQLYFQFGQQSTVATERAKFIGKITDLELQKKLQSVDAVIG